MSYTDILLYDIWDFIFFFRGVVAPLQNKREDRRNRK